MKLIICEKPSLAKTIANAIGISKSKNGYFECYNDYIVTFAFGHLLTLYDIKDYKDYENLKWREYNLPIIPDFRFKIKNDKSIKDQINLIKKLSSNANEIINCGDSDREGQIIIDNIINYINYDKEVKRLWLPDQTKDSIIYGLKNIKSNSEYKNLQNEGYARTYIDWLYGINLTVYLTNATSKMLNVGRVIVPIVKFIYDRNLEIKNFVPKKYFLCESKTNDITLKFKDKYDIIEDCISKCEYFNEFKAKVIDISDKEIKKSPGKLFSLSKLQSELSSKYKIKFKDSLNLIQNLYEKGLLTYPRTNTEYLSENEYDKISKIIDLLNSKGYNLINKNKKTIYDDSKIESHSAITITNKLNVDGLNEEELKVYNTVLNRFISNFLNEETIISERIMKINVGDEVFELKGNSILKEGFYKYEPKEFTNKLPNLVLNDEFSVNFIPEEKITEPPKLITESELSNMLKNPFRNEKQTEDEEYKMMLDGVEIGTEATRTPTIEKIKKIGYIMQKNSSYDITDLGIEFINSLEKLNINLWKEKSVELSKQLKKVYKNEISINDLIKFAENELKLIVNNSEKISLESFKKDDIICPICKEGKIYEGQKNYYCSNYKKGCKFLVWKEISKAKITKNILKELVEKGITKDLKFTFANGNTKKAKLYFNENFECKFKF